MSGCSLTARRSPRLVIQPIGCQIRSVRPNDGTGLAVDAHLSKVVRISEGCEHSSCLLQIGYVNVADLAVTEGQVQPVVTEDGYSGYVN